MWYEPEIGRTSAMTLILTWESEADAAWGTDIRGSRASGGEANDFGEIHGKCREVGAP